MPPIWTCPRGHQWEQEAAPPSADAAACPVCGAVPVGPLLKPDLTPGNTAEGMADTRQRAGEAPPFGLADVPVRQPPATRQNPLGIRPAPVAGNLDDTLMPMRARPTMPAPELDETMMRPLKAPPSTSSPTSPTPAPPPATPPQAKGCGATASAVVLAVLGGLAAAAVALARS